MAVAHTIVAPHNNKIHLYVIQYDNYIRFLICMCSVKENNVVSFEFILLLCLATYL